ncbi:MAG: hypothetical protein J6X62_01175, partial [Bacteroidales bacterium]|nr:hypothetical protein [Bacteroidales bacterium]
QSKALAAINTIKMTPIIQDNTLILGFLRHRGYYPMKDEQPNFCPLYRFFPSIKKKYVFLHVKCCIFFDVLFHHSIR